MSRHYIAFISYRHLPLDMEIAAKVHRTIEHYIVPKALRKDGKRQLGYVFRDKEELPVSRELTENIREALDNSEYLIVICTPDTGKSAWVLREIELFLETHDRDRVILVLADGSSDESFPEPLINVRNADGEIVKRYEPLAANLVAPNRMVRNRLFRTEILRVLAVLIGCSFDDLYRRARRYQRQRRIIALSAAGIILAAFIGMLLNRNAVIRRQLTETRINESKALAALSREIYRRGDISEAIAYALRALPSEENQRPYVTDAEDALSEALMLYRDESFTLRRSIRGNTDFSDVCFTPDRRILVTLDRTNAVIRAFDAETGNGIWSVTLPDEERDAWNQLRTTTESGDILVTGSARCARLASKDGSICWIRTDCPADAVSGDETLFLGCTENAAGEGYLLQITDMETGETLRSISAEAKAGLDSFPVRAAFSPGKDFAAVLRFENWMLRVDVFDLKKETVQTVTSGELPGKLYAYYEIAFTDALDVVVAAKEKLGSDIRIFYRADNWEKSRQIQTDLGWEPQSRLKDTLHCTDLEHILLAGQDKLGMFDGKSGDVLWTVELTEDLLALLPYKDGSFCLIRDDGSILYLTESAIPGTAPDLADTYTSELEIEQATAFGERYEESSFAVIPRNNRKVIALISPKEKKDLEQIAAPGIDYPSDARALFSASGEKMIIASYDSADGALIGMACDLRTGEKVPFHMPMDTGAYRRGDAVLRENFDLIEDGVRYDLSGNGSAEPQEAEDTAKQIRIGTDGTVELFDTHTGEKTKTIVTGIPSGSISGLLPAGDGNLLLAFAEEELRIFDLRTGELVSVVDFSEYGLTFHQTATFHCVELPDRHQLMVIADDDFYAESAAILLDTETWQRAATYLSVIGYDAVRDRAILQHEDGIYTAPLYTMEEKMEIGKQRS